MENSDQRETATASYQDYSSWEMLSLIWWMLQKEWRERGPTINFVHDFVDEFREMNYLVSNDFYVVAVVAVLFTIHRYLTTKFLFRPLGHLFAFKPRDLQKFPESCCKLLYYTAFLSAEYYLVNHKYPDLLYTPGASWIGYKPGMQIPDDIYWIYLIEAGFYFHGMFATVFMDMWRKDSVAMMFHHVLANALIIFSLAVRYHRIGIIVLYLHDAADVCLETTKILGCFKNRDHSKFWDTLCNLSFLSFTWIWFYFRLALYPQIVLFSAGYIGLTVVPSGKFYFFFNAMLWALFGLNLYWFHFIVQIIVKIFTKAQLEDVREEEEESANKTVSGTVNNNCNAATKNRDQNEGLKTTAVNSKKGAISSAPSKGVGCSRSELKSCNGSA